MDKKRILIVDDAELNREMLAEILGDKYDFLFAANGIEAVNTLQGGDEIDLILLDVNMPVMNGIEVLKIMNKRHWIEEIPVIIVSSDDSLDCITNTYQLGAVEYINRPFRAIIVQRKVENILTIYSNRKHLIQLVQNQVQSKEEINNLMINIFSNTIELRNHESRSHTLNVQVISELLLEELVKLTDRYSLTKSDIAMISSLSALHDIGKIKVPRDILNKPDKLTDEEWVLMKSHTVEGEAILKASAYGSNDKFIRTACEICRWHHEKYDGKGYPDGLSGDDIPIAAQVVSVADIYDALTSDRCYKSAFSHETAIQMLLNGECGAINPLLSKCIENVSEQLKTVKESGKMYDYKTSSSYIAEELLANDKITTGSSMRRMMDNERKKKEFFMECADGIQGEYDRLSGKITVVYKQKNNESLTKTIFLMREKRNELFPSHYWDVLREKLQKTTRTNPVTTLDMELFIDGAIVPYHAKVMAIWPEDGSEYISALAHFTKIDEKRP